MARVKIKARKRVSVKDRTVRVRNILQQIQIL